MPDSRCWAGQGSGCKLNHYPIYIQPNPHTNSCAYSGLTCVLEASASESSLAAETEPELPGSYRPLLPPSPPRSTVAPTSTPGHSSPGHRPPIVLINTPAAAAAAASNGGYLPIFDRSPGPLGGGGGGGGRVRLTAKRKRKVKPAGPTLSPEVAAFVDGLRDYLEKEHRSPTTGLSLSPLTIKNRINHVRAYACLFLWWLELCDLYDLAD